MAKGSGDGLYKDPRSPHWQIDVQYLNARLRRSARTTSRAEAKAIIATWKAKVRRENLLAEVLGDDAPSPAPEISFSEAAERYFQEVGRRAKSSDQIDANLSWVVANLNPKGAGPATLLGDVTEIMLLDLAAARRAAGDLRAVKKWRPCSEFTINRACLDLVRRVLRRAAVTWKARAAVIDWRAIRTPEPREGRAGQEMSAAQETDFFRALRTDLHDIVRFELIYGARTGALRGLQWQQVDFDAGVIRIKRKTRKPGEHWQELPMTRAARAILNAQRGRHPRFVFTYVVHRARGKRRPGDRLAITKTVMRQQLGTAFIAIGLEGFRPHDLRHTVGRRTLRASKNLRLVQNLLGHSDVATTAIYADVLHDEVRAAIEAMADAQTPHLIPGVEAKERENSNLKQSGVKS